MEQTFQPNLTFTAVDEAAEGEAFVVDLDGYEGPLHVLLALARTQKVDLLKLSITTLAEQYLGFVQEARRRNFAMAADYLVMASWLAFLKSRLLLPRTEKGKVEEPPAEEMAAALAFRLQKLEAMRRAVDALTSRPQLNRDVFMRGDPEARVIVSSDRVDANLYQLMGAYVTQRSREQRRKYEPSQRIEAFQLGDARDWLRSMMVMMEDWTSLEEIAPTPARADSKGPSRASYKASTLSASLELVKEGSIDLKQDNAFADVMLKRRLKAQPLELTP